MKPSRIVEIRSYKLKSGSGAKFHELMSSRSLPLLEAVHMDVIAFGQSLDDPEGYYLIRAYSSLDHLQTSQDAFYNSSEWREGPREEVLELIDSYANTVLALPREVVEALRQSLAKPTAVMAGDDE